MTLADPLTLFIFTGRNCNFTLYEDEGTNYNYEKEDFSNIRFSYNEEKKELVIDKREGAFNGMLKSRTFNIVFISKERPVSFDPDLSPDKSIAYNGEKISVNRN